MIHGASRGLKRGLVWLMVLMMAAALMPATAFTSHAASGTVRINYIDSSGKTVELEQWKYDSKNRTYTIDGSELDIVRDFTTKEAVSEVAPELAGYLEKQGKGYVLAYSGVKRGSDPRVAGVITKGILLEDLIERVSDKTGIDMKGKTEMVLKSGGFSIQGKTYDNYWGRERFYYPGWLEADEYNTSTEGYDGYRVPAALSVTGYQDDQGETDIGKLTAEADEVYALRNFQGQIANGNPDDINLGNWSCKNITDITFIPDDPDRPSEAAVAVSDKIDAIGSDITLQSEDAIKAARSAYDALSDEDKAQVSNYDDLVAAENKIAELKNTPAAVKDLKAKVASYNSVKLTWAKTTGASGYEVCRATSKSGAYKYVGKTTSTSYTNKSLTTGSTYYYKVHAYKTCNGKDIPGTYSSVASAKPVLAKTSVKLTAGKKKITVKWSRISGATGYKIYRSTKKSSGYKCVKTVTKSSTTSFVNKSLKKGTKYYYKVRAYRKSGSKYAYSSYSSVRYTKAK